MITRTLAIIGCLLILSGCGGPRIDATNRSTMMESTDKLRESLEEEQRDKVDKAILAIIVDALDPVEVVQYANNTDLMIERQIFGRIQPRFHKLNAEGLLEAGESARASLRGKLARWDGERAKLQQRQRIFQATAEVLAMVHVTSADLDVIDSPLQSVLPGQQVQVRLVVHNGSFVAIESLSMRLGVGPELSDALWADGRFDHELSPALEPGQSRELTVGPLLLTVPPGVGGQPQLAASIDITGMRHAGNEAPMLKTEWTQADALQEAVFDAAKEVVREMEVL